MLEETLTGSVASVILLVSSTGHLIKLTMFHIDGVFRMIINGRRRSLRHVSRTHRVDFD